MKIRRFPRHILRKELQEYVEVPLWQMLLMGLFIVPAVLVLNGLDSGRRMVRRILDRNT